MTPTNKTQKRICSRCEILQWHCNFGVKGRDQPSLSICLFCKMNDDFKNLRDEGLSKVSQLEERIKELENEIKSLKSGAHDAPNTHQNGDEGITRLDHKVVRLEQNCGLLESNLKQEFEALHNQQSMIINDVQVVKDSLIGFQLVTAKKASRPKRVSSPVSFETPNKFQILEDVEDYTILLGSSIVRDQNANFAAKNPKKRRVMCFPGAKINQINKEIENIKLISKKSHLITLIGSNDIFSKEGSNKRLDDIREEFMKLTDTIKAKTNKGIVVGILPRLQESQRNLGRAYSINNRVQSMCEEKGITFLNLWDQFYDRSLFQADGVHLNYKGKERLGTLIHKGVMEHKVLQPKPRLPNNNLTAGNNAIANENIIENRPNNILSESGEEREQISISSNSIVENNETFPEHITLSGNGVETLGGGKQT